MAKEDTEQNRYGYQETLVSIQFSSDKFCKTRDGIDSQ
jgi:hypothetical protein